VLNLEANDTEKVTRNEISGSTILSCPIDHKAFFCAPLSRFFFAPKPCNTLPVAACRSVQFIDFPRKNILHLVVNIFQTVGKDWMDQEKLVHFKGLLQGWLQSLVEEADKTVNGMVHERNGDFPDPTDRASFESDRNFVLRIKDRERKLITKIKEALDRIDNGTYGECESCGRPISEKRLMARPVTTECIDCKTEKEEKERSERLRGTRPKSTFPS